MLIGMKPLNILIATEPSHLLARIDAAILLYLLNSEFQGTVSIKMGKQFFVTNRIERVKVTIGVYTASLFDKTISNQLRMYVVVNDEVLETSTQIAFNEDATLGDLDNPFVVTLGYATAIGQMLTTNNYSLLRVVDVSGRIVYSGIPSDFDKEGLNDGVYIFELVTPDGQSVHYKQLIQD